MVEMPWAINSRDRAQIATPNNIAVELVADVRRTTPLVWRTKTSELKFVSILGECSLLIGSKPTSISGSRARRARLLTEEVSFALLRWNTYLPPRGARSDGKREVPSILKLDDNDLNLVEWHP